MRRVAHSAVKSLMHGTAALLGKTAIGRFAYGQLVDEAMTQVQRVTHRGTTLDFCTPNPLNKSRVKSFATKEPETLQWIDEIPRGSVLWDIGANVGLYTCYAAKARDCRVFAFEPSVFNLELLARNIYLNGITAQATLVPLALSESLAISNLNMTSTEWGGALSTFGQDFGHDGRPMQKAFAFQTLGASMNDVVELLKIPRPQYIKIDVDGIEHLILRGGHAILQQVHGVLIEVNDDFVQQSEECAAALSAAGLVVVDKRHSDLIEASPFRNTYNQIWARP